jgi:hypothetical protein
MNDQYIQLIEDYLAKGVAHPDIIENLGNDVSDDAAKFAADYLKKKDQPEQGGGSESTLDPSLSESAGADQMLDPFGRPITVGLKGVDIVAEKELSQEMVGKYGLEAAANDYTTRADRFNGLESLEQQLAFFKDEKNVRYFPEVYKEVEKQGRTLALNKDLDDAETLADVEQAFEDAGFSSEEYADWLEKTKAENPFVIKSLQAEEEYRARFGAPAKGEYDLSEIYNQLSEKRNKLIAEKEKVVQLWQQKFKEGYFGTDLRFLTAQIETLKESASEALGQMDYALEEMKRERDEDGKKLKDSLPEDSYSIYETYNNAYSVAISKEVEQLIKNAKGDQYDPAETQYVLSQMMRGDMTLNQAIQEYYPDLVYGESGVEFTAQQIRNRVQEEASNAAREQFSSIGKPEDATRIERDLKGILSVDFNDDGYVAPMDIFDSYLAKIPLNSRGFTVGGLLRNFSPGTVNAVRAVYEPIEKAVTATAMMVGDAGGGAWQFVEQLGNNLLIDMDGADEFTDYMAEWKREFEEKGTYFVPKPGGRLGFESTVNQAAYSLPFSIIQFALKRNPYVASAMLMTGLSHDLHARNKDNDWYKAMSETERLVWLAGHTGSEFGFEYLGNRLLFKSGSNLVGPSTGRSFLGESLYKGGQFAKGTAGEIGTELLTLFSGNALDNMMLTDYGVAAKPIFDATEIMNTIQVAGVTSGVIQGPVAGMAYAQNLRDVKDLRLGIDEEISKLRDPNLTEEQSLDIIKGIMAKQSKLAAKFTDMTEYGQWMKENFSDQYDAMMAHSGQIEAILKELKDPNTTQARVSVLKSKLATAMNNEYQASFVGLNKYLGEQAKTMPEDRLKARIQSKSGELDELKAEKAELEQRKRDGEDVSNAIALVDDKITHVSGALTQMQEAKSALEAAQEEGATKEEVAAGFKAANYVTKSEAQEQMLRLAKFAGKEISSETLQATESLNVTEDSVYMLDKDGNVIDMFVHADKKSELGVPVVAKAKDASEQMWAMVQHGYVVVGKNEETGEVALVYDKSGDLLKAFPGIKDSTKGIDHQLIVAKNASVILSKATGNAHKHIKIDSLAGMVAEEVDINGLSEEMQLFYRLNKSAIDTKAALIAANKAERKESDLAKAGNADAKGKAKDRKANKIVELARSKFGLNVMVGNDAQLFNASKRTDYMSGAIIGGFYVRGTNNIYINENASAKDVIEEIFHAKIANEIFSDKRRRARFQNELSSILMRDPFMRALLDVKRSEYEGLYRGRKDAEQMIEEELLAEAISVYVANSDKVDAGTVSGMINYLKSFLGDTEIDVTKDNLEVIMSKLETTLSSGRSLRIKRNEDQEREENSEGTEMMSAYSGKNSFLHKVPVSIKVVQHSDWGESRVRNEQTKQFEDYNHFRAWYNKMSGNGSLSGSIEVKMSYTDADGNVKTLNPPKPYPGREATRPVNAWASRYQRELNEQEKVNKIIDDRVSVLQDQLDILMSSGMDRTAALDLLGWDGRNRNWGARPTQAMVDKAVEATSNYMLDIEGGSPESVVMYSTYNDIVDRMNEVLASNDKETFDIGKYRSDDPKYRESVNKALMDLTDDPKTVKEFQESILGSSAPISNAEIQNFLTAVSDKLHGGKRRDGMSAIHQDRVVDVLEVPFRRLMETERGADFVNFFSDFREGLPNHFQFLADEHGLDRDDLLSAKDLYLGIVAVLSNGNEANINIQLADYVFASYMSGDKASFELAMHQILNVGSYKGISGRPEIQRTKAHQDGIRSLVDMFESDVDLVSHFTSKGSKNRKKPRGRSVEKQKEVVAMDMFGNKIGAFMANLLGDESVLAQDSHFVAEMNRARGIKSTYDINALKDAFASCYNLKEEVEKFYGIKLRKSYMRDDMEALGREVFKRGTKFTRAGKDRFKGFKGWEKEVFKWYTKDVKNRLRRTPKNMDERHLNYTIAKKLGDRLGISVAAVQQLMFYDNHLTQQLFGRGVAAEDVTFADVLDMQLPSSFEMAIPNEAALEEVKARDAYFRDQVVEKDLSGSAPVARDSFSMQELIDADELEVVQISDRAKDPTIGVEDVVTLKRARGGGRFASIGSGIERANAVVLSDVAFPQSKEMSAVGTIDSFANGKDVGSIDITNGIELEFHNGGWYSGGNRVIGAEKAVMTGDTVFAMGEITYSDPELFAYQQAEFTEEEAERFADDPFTADSIIDLMETEGLSFDQAEALFYDRVDMSMSDDEVMFSSQIRGTAARVVDSANFSGDLREMVKNNPENYFDRASFTDIKDAMDHMTTPQLLSYMRADKLGELKGDENYGPLATITLINRYAAAGDNESAAALVADLAATGTSVGRLLRQFAELKTSTPESMASTILHMAERGGKTVNDRTKKQVEEQSRIVFELHRRAEELYARGQKGEDVWDEYKKAIDLLAKEEKQLDIIANKIIERSWGELIRTTIQGNLLTPMSQATNVIANLSNFIPKTMVDVTAFPMEKLLEKTFPDWYRKSKGIDRKMTFSSYLYGMMRFGGGTMEALGEIARGQRNSDLTEWRISRSLMPIHSLMAFWGSDLPEAKSKVADVNQRAKLLFQGTFGMPAESMFRLLGLGDTPFRRYAEGLELSQIADARGLTGKERTQFLRFPPSDVVEQARKRGLEFTFQNDTSMSQVAEYTIGALSRGFGKPFKNVRGFDGEDFFNTIIRMNVPYIRTPANLLEETLTYASPAIAMARFGKHLLDGDARGASENLAKGMIGQSVTMASMYLIANGLISGPPDDDKAVRNLQYDTFPPNCINVSGLKRLLAGEDPAYQAGDEFRNYQKLGILGSVMGAAAVATTKQGAEEVIKNPFGPTELFKRTFGFDNVATLSYMMDQSFLQGLNSTLDVLSISNPDEAEKAWSQWLEGMFKSISAVPLPNTLSALNRTQRTYMPDMRSASMAERLGNTVRDRTFSTGSLPIRYNWKGEPIKQTPDGSGPAAYQLFDVTKAREGSADPVSMEALRIYQETGEAIEVLNTPYFASSVFRHIGTPSFSRGKAKKAYESGKKYQFVEDGVDFKMKLNAEQVNEALRLAGSLRYQECLALVESDKYKQMTDEERMTEFESINSKYNGLVEFDPQGNFLPHTQYLMDLFEKEYIERKQNGEL